MNGDDDILGLATDLVAAYVSNNQIDADQVPAMLKSVYAAMQEAIAAPNEELKEAPIPAVPADQSVHPDYIICLEDGQKYKSLKRHLRTKYEMTPKAYKEKWGLPHDYPMVAPNYSKERSRLAKRTGLGKS